MTISNLSNHLKFLIFILNLLFFLLVNTNGCFNIFNGNIYIINIFLNFFWNSLRIHCLLYRILLCTRLSLLNYLVIIIYLCLINQLHKIFLDLILKSINIEIAFIIYKFLYKFHIFLFLLICTN